MNENTVDAVAAEMRRQCGKSTDAPWEAVSARTKVRWQNRAKAVLEVMLRNMGIADAIIEHNPTTP